MSLIEQTVNAIANFSYGLVASRSETPRLSALDVAWAERGDTITNDRDLRYQFYSWYYEGAHRDPRDLDFADATIPRTKPTYAGRHNFMSVVVDVMVERLQVESFTVDEGGYTAAPQPETDDAAMAAIAGQLWGWWQQNRMDEKATTVHAQTLIKGDAFVFVDWCATYDRPRMTFNDALQVTPVYDAMHVMTAAYKTWVERYADTRGVIQLRYRITKYTPGFVEKFYRDGLGGSWQLWTQDLDDNGQSDGGVIVWQDTAGNPLGIPVFHFRNKPRGDDFGRSELDDLIPAQDSYNDRHWQADEAARYGGGPQKYVVGVQAPEEGWTSGPNQVWTMQGLGKDVPVVVGQFSAGNPVEMQDMVDRQLKTLAAMSRIPMHLLWPEGGMPSGESLKTAEAGLVSKCADRAVSFGNTWEDVLSFAVKLHNTFGSGPPIADGLVISTNWKPFQTRTELADAQTTTLIADDLSRRERLHRAGYNDQAIDRIEAEKAKEPQPMAAIDMFAQHLAPNTDQGGAANVVGG